MGNSSAGGEVSAGAHYDPSPRRISSPAGESLWDKLSKSCVVELVVKVCPKSASNSSASRGAADAMS